MKLVSSLFCALSVGMGVHAETISLHFQNISVEDDGSSSNEVVYKFTDVGTDSVGTNLNAFMTIQLLTDVINGASFDQSSGNGLLVGGGQGTGSSNDHGASTFNANSGEDSMDETIFFAIDNDTDAYVRFNIRFTDADDSDSDYSMVDTVLFQAFDIDQDTTNNDFSDSFGFIQSQTSAGPFYGEGTQLTSKAQTVGGTEYQMITLSDPDGAGGLNFQDVGNINTDPSDPDQVAHTVALVFDSIGTGGVDFVWGMTGTSGSRRGMFLSGSNPPLVAPVIPELQSGVLAAMLLLFFAVARKFR